MALNNCSITSQSFTKTGGQAIGSDNAQLVITPNTGYVVSASSFTNNTGSLDGISSISFSNSGTAGNVGNTVLVNVDLDDSYVMPSANTTLVIDIDGDADLISYTIAGDYDTVVSNATPSTETGTDYNGSGNYNQQITVFTKTFTAVSGYYFENPPAYKLTAANPERYAITYSDTNDNDGNLTARAFTVKYTLLNQNQSGDHIDFTASAIEIYTPAVEITAYEINNSIISFEGETRTMRVFGYPGATFSLSVENEDATSILSITNQAIPSSGVYSFTIDFPQITDSDIYNFVLTGDGVSSNFGASGQQPHTFSIKQLLDVSISIGLTHSDTDITISANKTKSLSGSSGTTDDESNFDHTFAITSSSINRINITDNTVTLTEFTNTDESTNGGTEIEITALDFTRVSNSEIKAVLACNVNLVGETDVTSILNLDNYLAENVAPVAQNVSDSVDKGDSTAVVLVATDSDNDAIDGADTLTYTIVTLPSNGTLYSDLGLSTAISAGAAITGTTVYYEHDDSSNLTDSFTFKANDGYSDSNTATANIAVGVSPGDSLSVSGGDGGTYFIPVILGTSAGTFKVHFNAISVPDRIEILFDTAGTSNDIADTEVVADSLFVGDSVTSTNPANGTTTGLNSYTYVGSGGNATGSGEPGDAWNKTINGTLSVTIADSDVVTDSGSRSNLTPNGAARNSASGNQVGVQNLVYTSTSDTTGTSDLDYHDGNICLTYTKGSTTAYTAYLKVTGVLSGTAWNIFQTEFIENNNQNP